MFRHRSDYLLLTYLLTFFLACLLTSFLPYLLTACSRVLEKLTGSQLVKKFPACNGNRKFITAFTSVCYLSLSLARSIKSMAPTSHLLKTNLNIILPSRPGSSKWSLSLSFPTKTLYTPLLSPINDTCPPISFFFFCHPIVFFEEYRSVNF